MSGSRVYTVRCPDEMLDSFSGTYQSLPLRLRLAVRRRGSFGTLVLIRMSIYAASPRAPGRGSSIYNKTRRGSKSRWLS
jgi:hypothetical protein